MPMQGKLFSVGENFEILFQDGYVLADDGFTCDDVNECEAETCPCDYPKVIFLYFLTSLDMRGTDVHPDFQNRSQKIISHRGD